MPNPIMNAETLLADVAASPPVRARGARRGRLVMSSPTFIEIGVSLPEMKAICDALAIPLSSKVRTVRSVEFAIQPEIELDDPDDWYAAETLRLKDRAPA